MHYDWLSLKAPVNGPNARASSEKRGPLDLLCMLPLVMSSCAANICVLPCMQALFCKQASRLYMLVAPVKSFVHVVFALSQCILLGLGLIV